MRRAAITACLAFFALTGIAQASSDIEDYAAGGRPFTANELRAYVVAVEYWKVRGADAEARCGTWIPSEVVPDGSLGPYDGRGGACRMQIVESVASGPFDRFCSLVVHEIGHEAERDHSTVPTDVMHPSAPAVAACDNRAAAITLNDLQVEWEIAVLRQASRCGAIHTDLMVARQARREGRARASRVRTLRRRFRACTRNTARLKARYRPLGWRSDA